MSFCIQEPRCSDHNARATEYKVQIFLWFVHIKPSSLDIADILNKGNDFCIRHGRHFHFIGQEPHHADAKRPPDDLPGPDGRHAENPGGFVGGITENGIADHGAGAYTEKEPGQGDDPGHWFEFLEVRGKATRFLEEVVVFHLVCHIFLVLSKGGNYNRQT